MVASRTTTTTTLVPPNKQYLSKFDDDAFDDVPFLLCITSSKLSACNPALANVPSLFPLPFYL